MISMRYHIVSLAAVFLALALGIVLGATKISSPLMTGLESDNADAEQPARRADDDERGPDRPGRRPTRSSPAPSVR